MATFFFCGIGGIGMSSIALYLKNAGHRVLGSDRGFDLDLNGAMKKRLTDKGILLYPQDGSGVTEAVDCFVVSTAVEDSIPDVKKALSLGLPIQKRAQMLADIMNEHTGVCVAGTSGKTTTTAMLGHILYELKKDPTMINGGISLNTYHNENPSNLIFGNSDIYVAETDESDGSIELYTPWIGIVTNISLDHKPLEEIRPLFERFLERTKKGVVINLDCPETAKIKITHPNVISFSVKGNPLATLSASHVRPSGQGVAFDLNGAEVYVPVIGTHNVENALAAIGGALHLGLSVKECISALQSFKGTHRRLEKVGTGRGILVIDDYAHNPEKIRATLQTLKQYPGHIWAIFQPHGFAPTRLMKTALIRMFKEELTDQITLLMPEIYYVGGTVAKDISARDVVDGVGEKALFFPNRSDIVPFLSARTKAGDTVVVMGARDDTLTDLAKEILMKAGML